MGTVHLIVDDEHKLYFDMDNFLLPPEARREQSFELFLLKANDGDTETPCRFYALPNLATREGVGTVPIHRWCRRLEGAQRGGLLGRS